MSSLTCFCIVEKLIIFYVCTYMHASTYRCTGVHFVVVMYRLLINHLFRQEQNFSVLLSMFGIASLGGLALTTGFESIISIDANKCTWINHDLITFV